MKKSLLSMIIFAFSLFVCYGENLVKNGNFSECSRLKLPLKWELKAKQLNSCKVIRDDKKKYIALEASAKDKNIFLIQYHLDLKKGFSYKVSYEVRSKELSSYRVYTEWRIPEAEGKYRLKSENGYSQKAPAEWSKKTFSFSLPHNALGAYIVLNVRNDAKVEFSNIKIVEIVKNKDEV